jgi:hypothetical protein
MVKALDLTNSPVGMPLVREYPWIVRRWYPLAVSATMADEDIDSVSFTMADEDIDGLPHAPAGDIARNCSAEFGL